MTKLIMVQLTMVLNKYCEIKHEQNKAKLTNE